MLRALWWVMGLALCSASAFGAEAGRIVFVIGKAALAAHPAVLDAAVQEGDELSTGADGYIYMNTVDNGFLILRPNSKARVTAYHIDPKNPANNRVKLELLSGVARSISGDGVKQSRQNFRFNTPVAAIGVRGTDFIVYTNEQSSWVSVVSGGVVVSGFAGACDPQGGGPCEGSASRELFAGRADAMLQVQRGQVVPQLLHNIGVAPELNVPARSDEPVGKVGESAKSGQAALNEVSLDPAKSAVVLRPPVAVKPDLPPTQPPVVVVAEPPAPVVKANPEIIWGRFQPIADLPADETLIARVTAAAGTSSANQESLGGYIVARPLNSSFVMPREGSAGFVLIASEATMSKLGGDTVLGKVENAHLNINFGTSSYTTGLSVVSDLGKVDMSSTGSVGKTGNLDNYVTSPGFLLRGLLGGAKADEAAYVFKSTGTPDLSVTGVTHWSR